MERSLDPQINYSPIFKFVAGVKSVSMKQLARSNLRYLDIQKTFEISSATHLVLEIVFGAECSLTIMKN